VDSLLRQRLQLPRDLSGADRCLKAGYCIVGTLVMQREVAHPPELVDSCGGSAFQCLCPDGVDRYCLTGHECRAEHLG
jgi:hypothetical protein